MSIIGSALDTLRSAMLHRSSRYRAQLDAMPAGLFAYWQGFANKEFEAIATDRLFFMRAAEGLMMFFDCVKHSGRHCGLPSKAADSVWHAWAKHAPQHLTQFCMQHFGRAIPHIEAAAMPLGLGSVVANCLVAARRLESQPPASLTVPRLFALDGKLRMPHGFDYLVSQGKVGFRFLDGAGKPGSVISFPLALAAPQLLAVGLLTTSEYERQLQRDSAASSSDSTSSGSSSSSSSDCNAGSSADCDGGGGSSCGGGCGGGGGD
jgi:hypothetical protein